jgi:hypothetical protein
MTKNKATITWPKVVKWHICHRGPLGIKVNKTEDFHFITLVMTMQSWILNIPSMSHTTVENGMGTTRVDLHPAVVQSAPNVALALLLSVL